MNSQSRSGQEGMALVMALLVLLVLSVIGAALMLTVNTETKITGHKVRDTQALSLAEAGVNEAILRIRAGDVPDDLNPNRVTLVYNNVAGSLPVSGVDTTSVPTLQPLGSYLQYSTSNKTNQVLSIKYKTRGGQIVRYDDLANPKINTATGNPIWTIQSTGRQGQSSRTVITDVTRTRFNVLARAAVAANVSIFFKGNIKICGHDHRADTPTGTQPNACNLGIGAWWAPTVHGACLPGAWSTKGIDDSTGSPTVIGEPAAKAENQAGFYSGPWDPVGMTQPDFWSWVGPPSANEPEPPLGIHYLDDDAIKQNQSGAWFYNGGNGEGLLYVDGDLRLNGSFNYRGLIYVERDLTINGDCWILGGIIVNGKTTVKIANGSAVVLYSSEAIQQSLSKYGGNIRSIAWREL